MSDCTCGRSPTGKCVGWHDLTEKQYAEKKAAYEARQASKAQATLFLQASDTGQK
jgi:hypothetical protein